MQMSRWWRAYMGLLVALATLCRVPKHRHPYTAISRSCPLTNLIRRVHHENNMLITQFGHLRLPPQCIFANLNFGILHFSASCYRDTCPQPDRFPIMCPCLDNQRLCLRLQSDSFYRVTIWHSEFDQLHSLYREASRKQRLVEAH